MGVTVLDENFNPRSREGSDEPAYVIYSELGIFQSTLPRRERRRVDAMAELEEIISIHAPAKGATKNYQQHLACNFQFQSTLPRRERRYGTAVISDDDYFNPRSREGSDFTFDSTLKLTLIISIHAPAKGATLYYSQRMLQSIEFQSTLPRRERQSNL